MLIPTNAEPIEAQAYEGQVVLKCSGPKPLDVAFTPQAVLASLEPLRAAAEAALAQGRVSARYRDR